MIPQPRVGRSQTFSPKSNGVAGQQALSGSLNSLYSALLKRQGLIPSPRVGRSDTVLQGLIPSPRVGRADTPLQDPSSLDTQFAERLSSLRNLLNALGSTSNSAGPVCSCPSNGLRMRRSVTANDDGGDDDGAAAAQEDPLSSALAIKRQHLPPPRVGRRSFFPRLPNDPIFESTNKASSDLRSNFMTGLANSVPIASGGDPLGQSPSVGGDSMASIGVDASSPPLNYNTLDQRWMNSIAQPLEVRLVLLPRLATNNPPLSAYSQVSKRAPSALTPRLGRASPLTPRIGRSFFGSGEVQGQQAERVHSLGASFGDSSPYQPYSYSNRFVRTALTPRIGRSAPVEVL